MRGSRTGFDDPLVQNANIEFKVRSIKTIKQMPSTNNALQPNTDPTRIETMIHSKDTMQNPPISLAAAIKNDEAQQASQRALELNTTNSKTLKSWLEPIPKALWGSVRLERVKLNEGALEAGQLTLEDLELEAHGNRLYHQNLKWSPPIETIAALQLKDFTKAVRQTQRVHSINCLILAAPAIYMIYFARHLSGQSQFEITFWAAMWILACAMTLFMMVFSPLTFRTLQFSRFEPWTEPNLELHELFDLLTHNPRTHGINSQGKQ